MLIDKNGFFWAKNRSTYTRVHINDITFYNSKMIEFDKKINVENRFKEEKPVEPYLFSNNKNINDEKMVNRWNGQKPDEPEIKNPSD